MKSEKSRLKKFFFAMRQIQGNKVVFYVSIFLNCSADTLLFLSFPVITKYMLDSVLNQNTDFLNMIIIALIIMVYSFTIFAVSRYIFQSAILRTKKKIRLNLFKHFLSLPMQYVRKTHTGDLLTRSIDDVNAMSQCFGLPFRGIVFYLMNGIGAVIIMLILDYRLSLILIILGILSFFLTTKLAKKIGVITDKVRKENSKLNELTFSIYEGFLTIKSLGITSYLNTKFKNKNDDIIKLSKKKSYQHAIINVINNLISWINFTGIVIAGSLLFSYKLISISNVLAIIYLRMHYDNMIMAIGDAFSNFQNYISGAERVYRILKETPEKNNFPVQGLDTKYSGIFIKNLCFSYDKHSQVLKKLSIHFKEGKINAIVGSSGAGKSSIFEILLGHYSPDSGVISFFGKELGEYRFTELRALFSYVPQDCFLYNKSIIENIRYGNLRATKEDVHKAAKKVNIHDFIINLKQGYDTMINEKGINLSQGQKQRITIARALLKKAKVLLLDEVTSALDSVNESIIKDLVMNCAGETTVIVIAHRLSTIENADVVFVLDEGRIKEKGNHTELLAMNGLYTELYNTQFE